MDDALKAALAAAEDDINDVIADVLSEVADEFAAGLADATEIIAARFSVSSIARMWSSRVPRIVRRLLGVAQTAADDTATAVDAELPDGWDDLPARYDDDTLPEPLSQYVDTTEHLLRAVGDRLAEVAVDELSAGIDAGEDIDQLRDRLRAAFAREGAQLGPGREDRIARTESGRAWNTTTLAAAQALTGPDRPLVKQWLTRRDSRVRDAHDAVNGQLRLLDEPFSVDGIDMAAPGDPTAPPDLVINCRCVLAVARADRTAAYESQPSPGEQVTNPRKEPGVPHPVTAAAGAHTGAMIALMPTEADADRLAIEGGEPSPELHLTLFYLGDAADWTDQQRADLIAGVRDRAPDIGQNVTGNAFGANHWNAGSDSPSWVWAIGDDRDRPADAPDLESARSVAVNALEDMHGQPDLPVQHTPWVGHICAAYSDDPAMLPALEERLGPITFDRIRIAFAGDYTDIPLGSQEDPMPETTAAGLPVRAWSTPGDTAIAFENQETGDGRIFAPGALYWSAPGPWALQYADEMLMGHQGAELAGQMDKVGRDGDRITASGVLYATRSAGEDAIALLDEESPLGISVDLDDVDLEFVDRTLTEEDAGWLFASAHLSSVSLLRMEDGAYVLSASTGAEWTASGGNPSRHRFDVQLITGPGGRISGESMRTAFAGSGVLTAAAGDPDSDTGLVVHAENAGDFLLRITRARLRGATLVSMPAYDRARIVLDPVEEQPAMAAATVAPVTAATSEAHNQVVTYVCSSPVAVGARQVAKAVGISMSAARGHLVSAAKANRLVRLAPGLYVGASTLAEGATVTAAAGVEDDGDDLVASAWTAMRDMDAMPAAWFVEPTEQDMPPGSGGVHYASGRIFGWVAQVGEPHAGYPGRNLTIESLGELDMSHFLRAQFRLDDGSSIRAGAFTMNVPHHRDGAECDSASCQFDDSRTVAGIVTVGMNERGLWFSGAAAPWLSEWDRQVFATCQPSYHMRQGNDGRWQLRAVLSVPVPGHSSPLLASTIAERSNLALAASAAGALTTPDTVSGHADTTDGHPADMSAPAPDTAPGTPGDLPGHSPSGVEELAAALLSGPFVDRLLAAMDRRETERRAEIAQLAASMALTPDEITASAHPKGMN